MAYRDPCWDALGIAPTSDQRAIRSAYSTRLKAIDPETDPQAFIALREAFDTARWQAEWVDRDDDADESAEHWVDDDKLVVTLPFEPESALPQSADPRRTPWDADRAARSDAHANALAAMLQAHTDGETYASPAQKAEMLEHWNAITADRRMQEIAFFADADRWFGEMIAYAIPFSDPLILPATRFFGWTQADGTINQSWAAEKISRRYAAIDFMTAVEQPSHRLHAAWRELTKPADEQSRRGKVNPERIAELVTLVRTRHPDLEGAFHFYRLGLWDGSVEKIASGPSWRPWAVAIAIVAIILLRIAIYAPSIPRATTPPPQLQSASLDIEEALNGFFDGQLHYPDILKGNPELAKALIDVWEQDKRSDATVKEFGTDLRLVLNRWLDAGLHDAPPALLTDIHAINLEVAKALRAKSAAECRLYLEGGKSKWVDLISLDLHKRVMAVWGRALLAAKSDAAPQRRGGVSIPAATMKAASERSGLTLDQLRQALRFEGGDSRICTGRIGFMETVLALPEKQRLPFMRAM